MSPFTPRTHSPSQPQRRQDEIKLRQSSEGYPQEESPFSPYAQRHSETHSVKNLSFWENTDPEDSEEGDEWTERQSPTPFILALVILVVASALLWFLFQWASRENTNTPLIIAADTAPFKVRPENPGGMMIPHQDKLVYGRLSPNSPQPVERLLPPPEQPMPGPFPQQPEAAPPYPQQQHALGHPAPQQPYPQGQGYAPPQPGYPSHPSPAQHGVPHHPPLPQPQPYAPFPAQPAYPQQQYPSPPPSPYAAPPSPYGAPLPASPAVLPPLAPPPSADLAGASHNPSAVETVKPAEDEEEGDDTAIREGYRELNQLIAREADAPLKQPAKRPEKLTRPMPIDPGKHKVQIASLPSRGMAEQEMKRLLTHHGPLFGRQPWNIQKINLGPGRGFTHRLVLGSFSNHQTALKFCKKLRAEKIGCLVVAPANE